MVGSRQRGKAFRMAIDRLMKQDTDLFNASQ